MMMVLLYVLQMNENAVKYYDSRVDSLEMEIRASQSNPEHFT